MFQLAGSLTTGQYKWAVSKQRQRPQTANRLEGNAMPPRRLLWVRGSFSLRQRHYRKYRLIKLQEPVFAVFHGQHPIAYLKGSIDNQRSSYRHQVRICPFKSVSVRRDIALSATLRALTAPAMGMG